MSSDRERKDFVGFVSDATNDRNLMQRFRSIKTADEMDDFFKDSGFTDIPKEDCESILSGRDRMEKLIYRPPGDGDADGVGPLKGY